MMVLAIDTCGAMGSIALGCVKASEVSILALTELAGKTYSAQLVPAARAMLAEQSVEIGALEAVVVVNGPGSFTGVRIGVSSAKGLAEGLGIPLLAVSRLVVLAWKAGVERAAFDAGRGEFYVRDGAREFLLPAKDMLLTEPVAVCETSAQRAFSGAVLVEAPTAGDALRFAAPRLLAGDFTDVATLDGNYVRRSDAEIFSRTGAKTAGKAGVAVIRAMTEGDLDAILRLETDTPEAPHWERATYEGFLAEDGPLKKVFVAADDDRLAGFVAAQVVVDVCELESIAVGTATRRTGVGSALLATLIDWSRQRGASRMQLEVRAGNISAIGFYEYAGFRRDGLRRKYYQNPEEDAVLMSRVL